MRRERFRMALTKTNQRYGRMLSRLSTIEALLSHPQRGIGGPPGPDRRDPLLDTIGLAEGGPKDGAENHDRFIY